MALLRYEAPRKGCPSLALHDRPPFLGQAVANGALRTWQDLQLAPPVAIDPQQNWCITAVRDYWVIILFHRPVGAREHGRRNGEAEQLVAARL